MSRSALATDSLRADFPAVGTADMTDSLQVGLPIADVLVVKAVNNVFAHEQIGQNRTGMAGEQIRGNQIGLLNHRVFIATADCAQHLLAQPGQVSLELRQHWGGPEIPSERLVAVQQVSRVFLDHDINRVEQALQIALLDERGAKIRHEEVSDEHQAQLRHLDEQGIRRFSALHWDKFDAGAADLHWCRMVYSDVRLEALHVLQAETLAEKVFAESSRRIEFAHELFAVIAPGIETQGGIKRAEICMSANVVPVGVSDEDGREFRQTGRMSSERFVGGFGGVGPSPGVDANQLSPVVRDDEIVFSKLEA